MTVSDANLDDLIGAFLTGCQTSEGELFEWLTKYTHSCMWHLKVRFTVEEREDISNEMLAKGLYELRHKDMSEVRSPGGWIIKCMRNVMMNYMDKATYHTRMKKALCEFLQDNPDGLQLRRQCLEKDKHQPDRGPEYKGYGTL